MAVSDADPAPAHPIEMAPPIPPSDEDDFGGGEEAEIWTPRETEAQILEFPLPDGTQEDRLDRLIARSVPELSRSRIKAMILDGAVEVDGSMCRTPNRKVSGGTFLTVSIPAAAPAIPVAEDIPLAVIYEDSDLIVLDKPAGMVVHPAPGNLSGTMVNALLFHCGETLSGIGGVKRPGIVHRIDKETSGLLVVAKNDFTHQALTEQFSAHSIERKYSAVVWGVPSEKSGTLEGNIGRSVQDRKKMAVVRGRGKPAVTHFSVIRAFGLAACLMECQLETGRTHQIRVHMTEFGHPLIGDPLYGGPTKARIAALQTDIRDAVRHFPRQALHADILGFEHPRTGEWLKFASELPSDVRNLLQILET